MNIYLPDGSKAQQRAALPEGDIKLSDGRILKDQGPYMHGRHWFHKPSKLSVIATLDPTARFGELLHVSLALPRSLPSWYDVKAVRDAFFSSDVDCMMVLPQVTDYVNLHNYCLHVWQCPEEWGIR